MILFYAKSPPLQKGQRQTSFQDIFTRLVELIFLLSLLVDWDIIISIWDMMEK